MLLEQSLENRIITLLTYFLPYTHSFTSKQRAKNLKSMYKFKFFMVVYLKKLYHIKPQHVYITVDKNKHKNVDYSLKEMYALLMALNEKGFDCVEYLGIGSHSWAHLTFLGKKTLKFS